MAFQESYFEHPAQSSHVEPVRLNVSNMKHDPRAGSPFEIGKCLWEVCSAIQLLNTSATGQDCERYRVGCLKPPDP